MAILLVPDCAHHTSPAASTVMPRGWLPAGGLVDAVGNGSTPPATSTWVTTPALRSVTYGLPCALSAAGSKGSDRRPRPVRRTGAAARRRPARHVRTTITSEDSVACC